MTDTNMHQTDIMRNLQEKVMNSNINNSYKIACEKPVDKHSFLFPPLWEMIFWY